MLLKNHLLLNTFLTKLICNPIKRFYVTIPENYASKVKVIFNYKKEDFINKLKYNEEVEKQLARLSIAAWDYCIREYGENAKNHVPFLLDQYIESYLNNIIFYSKEKSPYEGEIKYIFNLVEKFYLIVNHLDDANK